MSSRTSIGCCSALFLLAWLGQPNLARGQGSIVTAVGPVNRSMCGVAVGCPIDSAGAIYWNPASMAGLEKSDMTYSAAMFYGTNRVSSVVQADSVAPGLPAETFGGSTRSNGGIGLLPTAAIFYKPDDSIWSFGFGAFAAGGFSANFPATPTNPVLSPRPPNGIATGPLFTGAGFGQFIACVSCQLGSHFAIGFGPTITSVMLQLDPGIFASPDDVNGIPTSPSATNTRMNWGGGFTAGLYGFTDNGWHFGTSLKSKQWIQSIQYNAADPEGFPRELSVHVDFPMIASIGMSYMGLEKWVFGADVRWVDFRDTPGLGNPAGFNSAGAITGPGMRSAFAASVAGQYSLTDSISVRAAYTWAENPVPDDLAFFNTGGSAIYNNMAAFGFSYSFKPTMKISMAYSHIFPKGIQGPFFTPAGPVAGSMVRIDQRVDILDFGVTVNY
jgi:long-chain fatty acid transport protein